MKSDFCYSKVLIHLHILGTYQQIKQSILVLSLLNIFTVFNTHTANQNVYGFVKDDHVVTILFVLTFSEMNIKFRFL